MEQEQEYHHDAQHLYLIATRIEHPNALIRTWTDGVSRTAGRSVTTAVEWLHSLDDVGRLYYGPADLDENDVEAIRTYHHEMVQKVRSRELRPR